MTMRILYSTYSRGSIERKAADNLETEKSADAGDYRIVLLFSAAYLYSYISQ